MLEVGISVGFMANNPDSMKNLSAAGIKNIEICFARYSDFEKFDFEKAKLLAVENNIRLWSLHLPFLPFDEIDPSATVDEIANFTFKTFSNLIKKGTSIGIDKFVVHPSLEPIEDYCRKDKLNAAGKFFSRLADEAEKYGAVIAVEDLPRTCLGNCSDEILHILTFNEKLRVCFDTNHLLKENNIDFIKKVGDKIITLHVSDFDFENERHWLCGEGNIDWQSIYKAIIDADYNGVWLYEVPFNATPTIKRRPLTCEDYFNNAQEIFSGKKPTPIGERFEKPGLWGPL